MAGFSCVMSSVSLGVECCTSEVVVLGMVCSCGSAVGYCVRSVCKCMCFVPEVGATWLAK